MSRHLFIRLGGADAGTECTWVTVDENGRLLEGLQRGSLEEAAAYAEGRRITLLVPALEVITTQAELPTTSQARLRQMLPYSLEDTFAEDVGQLMFAAGSRLESGAISVSVVARKKLDDWLDEVARAGIAPHAVYAESDGVPNTPSTLNVFVEGDVIFGRRPGQSPLTLQGLSLREAFGAIAATAENEPAVQHAVIYLDEAGHAKFANELESLKARLSSLNVKLFDKSALPAFAAKLVHEPGTNFLQGPYAPRSNWGAMVKPWRAAAALLLALGVASLAATAANYLDLRSQDIELTALLESACAERFSSSRLSQCEAEVRERLRLIGDTSGSAGSDFLSTLATVAEQSGRDNRFQTLSYRNSVLDLQMLAPDVPALDAFTQAMISTGRFRATIQSTNPEDAGIEGRIQIVSSEQ